MARSRSAPSVAALRAEVLRANVEIARRGLARFTFGNASAIDRAQGLVVIKPSGVPYEKLRASTLVVTDLDGAIVRGSLRPSSDLATTTVTPRPSVRGRRTRQVSQVHAAQPSIRAAFNYHRGCVMRRAPRVSCQARPEPTRAEDQRAGSAPYSRFCWHRRLADCPSPRLHAGFL